MYTKTTTITPIVYRFVGETIQAQEKASINSDKIRYSVHLGTLLAFCPKISALYQMCTTSSIGTETKDKEQSQ